MDKLPWKAGLEELKKDDITMQELYHSWEDEIRMEYPYVIDGRDARLIFRHALNRAIVGQVLRSEIDYYMEHGRFRA
jgi:hypothetical protein